VLAYLSRYTHRVAISNSRLIALDDKRVTFKWKDYRAKDGDRHKTMALIARGSARSRRLRLSVVCRQTLRTAPVGTTPVSR